MATQAPKTFATTKSVTAFIASVKDPRRRKDAQTVIAIMRKVTGERPVMWGPSIVGFGQYHSVYASGREGDWPLAAFSPRKAALTLYVIPGLVEESPLRARLGKHTISKSCVYLKTLDGVDLRALEELIRISVRRVRKMYP